MKNGELTIKPTILSDNFVRRGCLNLKRYIFILFKNILFNLCFLQYVSIFRCTKNGLNDCTKNASSFNIIPPIVSGKITTKNFFSSLYGQLEVEAKLPTGDWIVSGKYSEKQIYFYSRRVIAKSKLAPKESVNKE